MEKKRKERTIKERRGAMPRGEGGQGKETRSKERRLERSKGRGEDK